MSSMPSSRKPSSITSMSCSLSLSLSLSLCVSYIRWGLWESQRLFIYYLFFCYIFVLSVMYSFLLLLLFLDSSQRPIYIINEYFFKKAIIFRFGGALIMKREARDLTHAKNKLGKLKFSLKILSSC